MMLSKSLFILLFLTTAAYAEDDPIVEISNGILQGTIQKSYNGRPFSSFEGIPYARPPLGELRFEPPKEAYNWTGTWIANTQYTCLQAMKLGPEIQTAGSEDCLYINVYVPRTKPNPSEQLDVIVHIHGGGFMSLSGHSYAGPNYLMDKEVIFVTFNYRLGIFGFLSTEDDVVPGNNGMKDQVSALKWIQKNIKYFGGDPDSVTITGMSAGGASVHLHYFSPLSKFLFNRGVSQSGTALSPWAITDGAGQKAKRLAVLVGCPPENSSEMIKCLRSRSSNEIIKTTVEFYAYDHHPFTPFGPVVEKNQNGAFLTEHPHKMLLDKTVTDLPWIVSVTKNEGALFTLIFTRPFSDVDENFDKYAPFYLDYNFTVPEADKASIADKIKKWYFKDGVNPEDFAKLMGDRHFNAGADTSARLQAKATKAPIYFYILGYKGQHQFMDIIVKDHADIDATHGDDVLYYLSTSVAEAKLSKSDEKMKSIFLNLLTSFADGQYGGLSINDVHWPPVNNDKLLRYLYIESPDDIRLETAENLGSSAFWNNLALNEVGDHKVSEIKDEL